MIQIDMQMPKNCLDCPACNEYLNCAIPVNGRKWGENDVHEFGQGRPEWCPMEEQEAVVRCKNCIFGKKENDLYICWAKHGHRWPHNSEWFCADGKRKEGR